MHRIAIALLASAALADAPKPPSMDDMMVTNPKTATFNPSPLAELAGVRVSPIAVDPVTKASVGYGIFPAGYHLKTHWHTYTEYTLIISGAGKLMLDGKPHQLTAGSYVVVPPKTPHSFDCATGAECVVLTRRAGPTDYNWVK